MMTHHLQGGLRRRGQRRRRRGGSWWGRRPGCCWKRGPTRLDERRRSTELLPPWSTSPNHPPLYSPLPAKHKAFFCKFPQNQVVKEEKEEGDRYNPTLCLFSSHACLFAANLIISNMKVCLLLRCSFVKHSLVLNSLKCQITNLKILFLDPISYFVLAVCHDVSTLSGVLSTLHVFIVAHHLLTEITNERYCKTQPSSFSQLVSTFLNFLHLFTELFNFI